MIADKTFIVLILLDLILCSPVVKFNDDECDTLFSPDECSDDVVLYKTIYSNDDIHRLSTFFYIGYNKIELQSLVTFSAPNLYNVSSNNNNNLLWNIIPNVPLYLYSGYYSKYGPIIQDTSTTAYYRKIRVATKGKYWTPQVGLVHYKLDVLNIWDFVSSKMVAVFCLGPNSNIWSRFNSVTVGQSNIILSKKIDYTEDEDEITDSYYKVTKITCNKFGYDGADRESSRRNHKRDACNTHPVKLIEVTGYKEEEDDKIMGIESIKMAKSKTYSLVLDFESNKNYLPTNLYFLLYKETKWRSSSKKLNTKTDITLLLPSSSGDDTEEEKKVIKLNGNDFDFELNIETNEIILGSAVLLNYDKIRYNHVKNEFILWMSTSNVNDGIKIFISILVIALTFILVRWMTSPNYTILRYLIKNISTARDETLFSQGQVLYEILSMFLAVIIAIVTLIFKLDSEVLVIRNFLLVFLAYRILINVLIIIMTRGTLIRAIDSFQGLSNMILKKKPDNSNSKHLENTRLSISRNIIHVVIILLSISLGLNFISTNKLYRALLVLTTLLILYYSTYHIFTMLITTFAFSKNAKWRRNVLWILFIIVEIMAIIIFSIFIIPDVILTFLNTVNSVYSQVLIDLTSIFIIITVATVPSYMILSEIQYSVDYYYLRKLLKKKKIK